MCCLSYNHEKYIRETIDSILTQEYTGEIEIVIFDDHSTDSSRSIADEYSSRESKIRTISAKENIYSKGFTPLFNLVEEASGEYIFFCECDDYWNDIYKISKQVDALEKNKEYNIAFHPAFTLNDKVNDFKYGYNGNIKKVIDAKECIAKNGPLMPLASIAVRSETLKNLWLSRPDFFMRNAWHSVVQMSSVVPNGAIYLPDYMSTYRSMHDGSWSLKQKNDKEQYLNNFISYSKRIKFFREIYQNSIKERGHKNPFYLAISERAVFLILTRGIKSSKKFEALKLAGLSYNEILKICIRSTIKASSIVFRKIGAWFGIKSL